MNEDLKLDELERHDREMEALGLREPAVANPERPRASSGVQGGSSDVAVVADGSSERRTLQVRSLFAISSRVGVWGLLAGITGAFASLFGADVPGTAVWWTAGVGTLAGGLGVTVASALVLGRFRTVNWKARFGALVGIPFGLSAALTATGWLLPEIGSLVPGSTWIYGIFNFAAGTMALLGLVLGVLIGTGLLGFVKDQYGAGDPDR